MDPKLETLKIVAHRNEQRFGWGLSYLSRKLPVPETPGNSAVIPQKVGLYSLIMAT
jgi:hypothetical protein